MPNSAKRELKLCVRRAEATRNRTRCSWMSIVLHAIAPLPCALRAWECKGCLGTTRKGCHGTEQLKLRTWGTLRAVFSCACARAPSFDRRESERFGFLFSGTRLQDSRPILDAGSVP